MNCPLCTDQILTPTHRSGIEIDICPNCKGIWLDRGELERLAQTDRQAPSRVAVDGPAFQPSATDDESFESAETGRGKKGKKKKPSLASRLGDILEEVIDL